MRVLVVDDSADIRYIVRFLLEEAGMEVEEARTGQAAIDILSGEHDIDAVVLDQRMPDRTGLEVAAELEGGRPRVILFSDYLHPTLQAEGDRAGVIRVNKSDLNQLVDVLRGESSRAGG